MNGRTQDDDEMIDKLDGKFKRRKEKQAMLRKDFESFKSSLLNASLSSTNNLNEDKQRSVKKLCNMKAKMMDLKEDFVNLLNLANKQC